MKPRQSCSGPPPNASSTRLRARWRSCPVGYQRPEGGVRVIGAAYAPTDEGREALRAAVTLARAGNARVVAISVQHPDHAAEQSHGLMAEQHHDVSPTEAEAGRARKGGEDDLAAVIAELGRDVEIEADLLVNDPADGLIAASRRVDMLIMGSRALGPKRAVLLGSVSRKVVAGAACPVPGPPARRGGTDRCAARRRRGAGGTSGLSPALGMVDHDGDASRSPLPAACGRDGRVSSARRTAPPRAVNRPGGASATRGEIDERVHGATLRAPSSAWHHPRG